MTPIAASPYVQEYLKRMANIPTFIIFCVIGSVFFVIGGTILLFVGLSIVGPDFAWSRIDFNGVGFFFLALVFTALPLVGIWFTGRDLILRARLRKLINSNTFNQVPSAEITLANVSVIPRSRTVSSGSGSDRSSRTIIEIFVILRGGVTRPSAAPLNHGASITCETMQQFVPPMAFQQGETTVQAHVLHVGRKKAHIAVRTEKTDWWLAETTTIGSAAS